MKPRFNSQGIETAPINAGAVLSKDCAGARAAVLEFAQPVTASAVGQLQGNENTPLNHDKCETPGKRFYKRVPRSRDRQNRDITASHEFP